jgi:hypothetical protein
LIFSVNNDVAGLLHGLIVLIERSCDLLIKALGAVIIVLEDLWDHFKKRKALFPEEMGAGLATVFSANSASIRSFWFPAGFTD